MAFKLAGNCRFSAAARPAAGRAAARRAAASGHAGGALRLISRRPAAGSSSC